MNKTQNYQLNQWEADDRILRTDFNADNAKIDAALASMPVIATGTYTGDGVNGHLIPLGFRAKAVLVLWNGAILNMSTPYVTTAYGGLAIDGIPAKNEGVNMVTITDQGFEVRTWGSDHGANIAGEPYTYLAIG